MTRTETDESHACIARAQPAAVEEMGRRRDNPRGTRGLTCRSTHRFRVSTLSRGGLLMLALLGMAMAGINKYDGLTELQAPFDNNQHTEVCAPADPRPCPILAMKSPLVKVRSQEPQLLLRKITTLSDEEREQGATIPFFIYNYKTDSGGNKRYTVYNGTETVKLTIETSMGSAPPPGPQAYEHCEMIIDAGATGFKEEATLTTGPFQWSATGTLRQLNCLLGRVFFKKEGAVQCTQKQIAEDGALSIITVYIRNAEGTNSFSAPDGTRFSFKKAIAIFREEVLSRPFVSRCPTFSYPFPDRTQIPSTGLPDIEQPIPITSWNRSRLTSGLGGLCLTEPIAMYPEKMTQDLEDVTCPNTTFSPNHWPNNTVFSPNRWFPTCRPCGITQSNWFYVFEDSPTVMQLSNIQFTDGNFFYGTVKMSMQLVFDQYPPFEAAWLPSSSDPIIITARTGNPSAFKYCASTDDTTKACASNAAETYGNTWVPEANAAWGTTYQIRIVDSTKNAFVCAPGSEGCYDKGKQDGSRECIDEAEPTTDLCPCRSGICFALNEARTLKSKILDLVKGSSRLWFEIVDVRKNLTSNVVQTGYIDLVVKKECPCTKINDRCQCAKQASGSLYAYPKSRGGLLNWFKFSPLVFTGTWLDENQTLTVDMETDPFLHGSLVFDVESDFGLLDFPAMDRLVQRTPALPASKIQLRGTLQQLTSTLGQIRYQVNRRLYPHLNTQTKNKPRNDRIRITYDKNERIKEMAALGLDLLDNDNLGPITAFEVPVTILATNDRPTVMIPEPALPAANISAAATLCPSCRVSGVENVVIRINGVSLVDVDADEVVVSSLDTVPSGACPSLPGEAHHLMTLEMYTVNGKVFFNDTHIDSFDSVVVRDGDNDRLTRELTRSCPREIIRKLLNDAGDVRCGFDDLPLCTIVPSKCMKNFVDAFEVKVFVGFSFVRMTATLSCLNRALQSLKYMPVQDYNSVTPPDNKPADKLGCPTVPVIPKDEFINFTIQDNQNTGCVGDVEVKHSAALGIWLEPVQQPLFVQRPMLVNAIQGFRFSFNDFNCEQTAITTERCGSIALITRDNGDVTILERYFRLRLTIQFGTLSFAKSENLEFQEGDGSDDMVIQVVGKLCDLNRALQTLSYMPSPGFTTLYHSLNKTWMPPSRKEFIKIHVQQPDKNNASKLIGPDSMATVPVAVKQISGPGIKIRFIMPGDPDAGTGMRRQSGAKFVLKNRTSDIFFCGGKVVCECPKTAVACVQLEDVDACVAKEQVGEKCESKRFPSLNPRLLIRSTHNSLWFFDGESTASWIQGETAERKPCSIRSVSTRHLKEMDGYFPGETLHTIDLMIPMPLVQSGFLRVWASERIYGDDILEISLQSSPPPEGVRFSRVMKLVMQNTWCASHDPPCENPKFDGGAKADNGPPPGSSVTGLVIIAVGLASALALCLCCIAAPRTIRASSTKNVLSSEESLELSQVQQAAKQHQREKGTWILARDANHRPFWYHSLTRKTTYIDPEGKGKYAYALENLLEKDAFRLEYERIVAESDINELRNAHVQSADAMVRARLLEAQDAQVQQPVLQVERYEHRRTGENFSQEDLDIVHADYPGAWNAQAEINDVDNSLVTAMLITKSKWVKDNDKTAKVAEPLLRLAKAREQLHERRGPAARLQDDVPQGDGVLRDEHLVAI